MIKENGGWEGKRVLVIHSGGDSKRVPQYSALGKLFSPVPHDYNRSLKVQTYIGQTRLLRLRTMAEAVQMLT